MAKSENVIESSEDNQEKIEAEDFLSNLYRAVEEGHEDAAMQMIYGHLHALRLEGKLSCTGRILEEVKERRLPPVLLVALLTITAPLKSKLASRAAFFVRAKQAIAAVRGPEPAGRILIGLE